MPTAHRHVLCIDDDPQSLKVRKVLLESRGFLVATAVSGPEGLRAVRAHDFEAVVLDYHMPGMDGGEVAREMKKWDPALPVIILSALPWLPEDAPRECIDAFVSKGEPMSVLINALDQATAQREAAARSRGGWPHHLARFAGAAAGLVAATVGHVVRHRKPAQHHVSKEASRSVVA